MSDTTDDTVVEPAEEGRPPAHAQQVDDTGELQTGDFGLDGNLKDTIVEALEKRWGETQDDADTDSPPAPAPSPASDGEGGAGTGDDAPTGAAPDDAPPVPAPTPDDGVDLNQYAHDYFGTNLNRDQARELFATLNGLQNLTPEQRVVLDRTLAGEQVDQYPATTGQPAPAPLHPGQVWPPLPQSDDPAVAVLGPRPDDEYLAQQWDLTASGFRAQQQQLAQLREGVERNTQMELERQRQQDIARIEEARDTWRGEYTVLSDGEFDGLSDRIIQSGVFPALLSANRGDAAAATRAAYEQFFWSDPNLRQRAQANLASGRSAGDGTPDPNSPQQQQAAEVEANRQARAASVAGGGGSTTQRTQPEPKTREDRQKAMVAEIAASGQFT